MSEWHTLQTARADWADAKQLSDLMLTDVLELAKDAVWHFEVDAHPRLDDTGAEIPVPADVPVRYRVAQLLQARSVWQLPRTGDQGAMGLDEYAGRVYVFGKDIQKVIVPPTYGEAVG